MIAELDPPRDTEETFSRLVSEYQEKLLRMCMLYLRDGAAAEDAVQETFLKAYRALPQFRGECSEKTWLMRIALNVCRDMAQSGELDRYSGEDQLKLLSAMTEAGLVDKNDPRFPVQR